MNPVEYAGKEKRITFQLYNYWFGLAGDGGIPPLKSLSPEDIAAYKNNMVLIDLRDPNDEPTLQVIGQLLNEDLDQNLCLKNISDIPRRTLLSRITDHYMEVLANKSPISFDAEFNNKAREKVLYRGILLPFSDDGENINFILGAIRWITEEELLAAKGEAKRPATLDAQDEIKIEDVATLQKHLNKCRKLVQGQNPSDTRSRKSLYEALGAILDFHKLCLSNLAIYEGLLEAEELKSQKRAPFTPTLKLCFGRKYDKTRLTEYAAALSFALKNGQDGTKLPEYLERYPGGIKGCVQAERDSNNITAAKSTKKRLEDFEEIACNMTAIASFDVNDNSSGDDKLCLLLARRSGSRMEVIKILKQDKKVMAPILKQVANDP